MKRVLKYVLRYKLIFLIPFLSMGILIALDMFNPYLTRLIIDKVIIGGEFELLNKLLLGLLGITLGRAILGYIREFMFDYAGTRVALDLRKDLFTHIQTLPFDFFDGTNTGEIMNRTTEDVNNVWRAVGFGIGFFLEQIVYFIIATIMLFTIDWKLALICIATMPLMAQLAFKLERKIGEAYEKISDQGAVLNTTAQENLAGVRLVKAFGRERHEINKFFEQNKQNYKLNLEQARVWATYHPKIEFLSNLVVVVVVSIGGMLVVGGDISIGNLVAFNGYVMMLIWPMRLMGWLTNVLAQCNASAKKIFAIMDTQPTIKSPENPKEPKEYKGSVVFENVSFKYNDTYVLKNINIEAKPGSTIAIMGATGSGKTSIINLMARYYDCTEGKIIVDGVDIKEMDLTALRSNISVVMQDTFLFSDTIEQNIKFADPSKSQQELIEASQDALVDEFVRDMEDGYDTVIGERGIGLSGGQKQRISIARALLKDSKILILDDATSALDMETEYQIQKALERRRGMTKFIIAHRISAVKNADEIIVIENGSVLERGTHKNLLWKKGKYYQIYKEQFKDIDDIKEEVI